MTGEELYMAKDHPTGKSGLYAAFLELETPEECYRFLQDVCRDRKSTRLNSSHT